MAYTTINFKTKKAVCEAIEKGERITVYSPGLPDIPASGNGTVSLCGPHFPEPHRWYGTGLLKDGLLVEII